MALHSYGYSTIFAHRNEQFTTMIKIGLPDGAIKEMPKGSTAMDVALSISEGLARNVISASFNAKTVEVSTPLQQDGDLVLYTWRDDDGKKAFWHSSAHILAQAIEESYPGVHLTIGPAIENGFYYDIDFGSHSFSDKDFEAIEKKALEIAREKHEFKLREVRKTDALDYYKDNPYKTELIEGLEDGEITFCDHSSFTDLCRGGHLPHTGFVKAFKILNVAGAYWRGDEKNAQLTRVYGISFPKQKELKEYLTLIEEAKKKRSPKTGKRIRAFCLFSKGRSGITALASKRSSIKRAS
jgi:threonyl-tRNA synthetase